MGLTLTQAAFEALHERLDRVRRTSSTVTVDRQALAELLLDHGRVLKRLAEVGERVSWPGMGEGRG